MSNKEIYAFLNEALTFTTRESYVEWRAIWRNHYAELSKEIRRLRNERSRLMKANEYADNEQAQIIDASVLAFSMLEIRAASKVRAEEQYTLIKAARLAA